MRARDARVIGSLSGALSGTSARVAGKRTMRPRAISLVGADRFEIAGVLAASGYTDAELDGIWRWEIVPECIGNLLQVAGEWEALALDEAALVRRASRRRGPLRRLFPRLPVPMLEGQWRAILSLRARLLDRAPQERGPLVKVWSAFAHAYLAERLGEEPEADEIAALAGVGLPRGACEETFAADFRPIYRLLLSRSERGDERQRSAEVLRWIGRVP